MPDIFSEAGTRILRDVDALAGQIAAAQLAAEPYWRLRYGADSEALALQDTRYHLLVLGQALLLQTPALLTHYVDWAAVVLQTRGVTGPHLDSCLFGYAAETLRARLPQDMAAAAMSYIGAARQKLTLPAVLPPSHLSESGRYEGLARQFLAALLAAQREEAEALIRTARKDGVPVEDLYLRVLAPCLREVGRLWQVNTISVAQEHFSTAATQRLISELYPALAQAPGHHGKVVVACIGGESHDIGARMVSDLLAACGWDSYYLGPSVPRGSLVRMLGMTGAGLLALSCSVPFHIGEVGSSLAAIRQNAATSHVRVIVGGRAFDPAPALAERLGADAYVPDAAAACVAARSLREQAA